MKIKRNYIYLLILIGFVLGLYAEINNSEEHQIILILGIAFLGVGLFFLAKSLPSKKKEPDTYVKTKYEKEDE